MAVKGEMLDRKSAIDLTCDVMLETVFFLVNPFLHPTSDVLACERSRDHSRDNDVAEGSISRLVALRQSRGICVAAAGIDGTGPHR